MTRLLPGNYGSYYDVIAHYSGDQTYAPSDSAAVSVQVLSEDSITSLSVFGFDDSGNMIPFTNQPYGRPAYLRADVEGKSGYGVPTGQVSFVVGQNGQPYDLNSKGAATTATGLWNIAVGTQNALASYHGDGSFHPSDATPVSITVTPASTSASLAESSGGGQDTLTATISTTSGGNAPTGTVTFFADGVQVGSPVPVSGTNGSGNLQTGSFTAAVSTAMLTASLGNAQNITATYNGDSNYSASTPASPNFGVVPAAPSLTVAVGQSGSLNLIVRSLQGFGGTINFSPSSCSGLPFKTTCSFNPSSVTAHGTTTLTITTTALISAMLSPTGASNGFWAASTAGFAIAGACLLGVPSKRRRWASLSILMVAFLTAGIGCGGGGSSGGGGTPGTPRGSYTVTVTGTSGALLNQTTFTLIVK
jgi:hypothetical protein